MLPNGSSKTMTVFVLLFQVFQGCRYTGCEHSHHSEDLDGHNVCGNHHCVCHLLQYSHFCRGRPPTGSLLFLHSGQWHLLGFKADTLYPISKALSRLVIPNEILRCDRTKLLICNTV